MRKIIELQMEIGEVSISEISFDSRSRDEITQLLIGLQAIYVNHEIRNPVFDVLNEMIPKNTDPKNGRPGMTLWKIFVLGTLRLCCNWDYDKLMEIANNHWNLRLMLGHPEDDRSWYALQTLKDNIALFTPEILDHINQIIVKYGQYLNGAKDAEINGSCDSFVLETDVHFPTDINMLFDAARKMLSTIIFLCDQLGLTGWRKGKFNIKKTRRLFLNAQRIRNSTSKNEKKKDQRQELKIKAHLAYIDFVESIIIRIKEMISFIQSDDILTQFKIEKIENYIVHAERQIDQIHRRVVESETIPHHEKVFSIFEEHTEWISKGKAGVSQELGLKVCVVKDQFGFILHHRVMQNETDDKIAVPIVIETKNRFPNLNSCSFDKGFHSPQNQNDLKKILDRIILPRKGKLSRENREIEGSEEFKEARRKHSAVESTINALENHGLDRCRDHGLHGFKRYVALAIVARNIQIIGATLQKKEVKRRKKDEKKRLRLAA
jgi:hypothetical protein